MNRITKISLKACAYGLTFFVGVIIGKMEAPEKVIAPSPAAAAVVKPEAPAAVDPVKLFEAATVANAGMCHIPKLPGDAYNALADKALRKAGTAWETSGAKYAAGVKEMTTRAFKISDEAGKQAMCAGALDTLIEAGAIDRASAESWLTVRAETNGKTVEQLKARLWK